MSTQNSTDLGNFSRQYAARDLPGQQKLKYRDIGQAAPEEIRKENKDLRKELEDRERLSSKDSTNNKYLPLTEKDVSSKSSIKKQKLEFVPNLDADEVLMDSDSDEESDNYVKKKNKISSKNPIQREIDENSELENSEDEEHDDDDDDDEDDDTEALMAELNRIKQERASEAAKQEAERKAREEKIRVENILKGNPLLNPGTSKSITSVSVDFKVKRRWDDDVVFKNCAKMDDNKKKIFINDTLRSEFHKKFMERYIK